MEKTNEFGKCPYLTSQKVLTGKWSMYIMYLLSDGPVRFNELQRRMPEEMTHTTLNCNYMCFVNRFSLKSDKFFPLIRMGIP